jgi:anaerobic magnesium-protoporphyrin IX monomethyl ester cyclase
MNTPMIRGVNQALAIDALFVNSPLKNYDDQPRLNDFTLPVLGLGYIATFAANKGFNVGVLDAEALGLGISEIIHLVNQSRPRWVGLNLLAPTYHNSVEILRGLAPDIQVMLGGHQSKAMPLEILNDVTIPRVDALILGEGETRCAALLEDRERRVHLPGIWYRENGVARASAPVRGEDQTPWSAPDINKLPFVNRQYFIQDPLTTDAGVLEANLVGSRGCPYDCSFCGAAKSANPDVTIRTREPQNLLEEMFELEDALGVTSFRFVDDLFLANPGFMKRCLAEFIKNGVGERFVWDATGRINVLSKAHDALLDAMKEAGCREVALGIESGNERVLRHMDKHITPSMTLEAVERLTAKGINVKGYVIMGFPTETERELQDTRDHIEALWKISDRNPGTFRCSVFEFRPYPGTPEWNRLIATGKYRPEQLLNYTHVDLTDGGVQRFMLERDEFNFSVGIQFGTAPLSLVRSTLREITQKQMERKIAHAVFPHLI